MTAAVRFIAPRGQACFDQHANGLSAARNAARIAEVLDAIEELGPHWDANDLGGAPGFFSHEQQYAVCKQFGKYVGCISNTSLHFTKVR